MSFGASGMLLEIVARARRRTALRGFPATPYGSVLRSVRCVFGLWAAPVARGGQQGRPQETNVAFFSVGFAEAALLRRKSAVCYENESRRAVSRPPALRPLRVLAP